jgi:sugar phosphate isomerase/epimerase
MNPIGINLWNWTGDFNQSKIEYINKAAKLGYTAIEIGVAKKLSKITIYKLPYVQQ